MELSRQGTVVLVVLRGTTRIPRPHLQRERSERVDEQGRNSRTQGEVVPGATRGRRRAQATGGSYPWQDPAERNIKSSSPGYRSRTATAPCAWGRAKGDGLPLTFVIGRFSVMIVSHKNQASPTGAEAREARLEALKR